MSVFHGLSDGKIEHAELTGVGVGVGGSGVFVGVGVGATAVGVGGTGVFVGVAVGAIGVGVHVGVGVRVGVGFLGRASDDGGTVSCRSWPIASAARTEASAPRDLMTRISKQ